MTQNKSSKEDFPSFEEFDKKYGTLFWMSVLPIYYIAKFFKKIGIVPILLIFIILILLFKK